MAVLAWEAEALELPKSPFTLALSGFLGTSPTFSGTRKAEDAPFSAFSAPFTGEAETDRPYSQEKRAFRDVLRLSRLGKGGRRGVASLSRDGKGRERFGKGFREAGKAENAALKVENAA
jgi:hypothetical protein